MLAAVTFVILSYGLRNWLPYADCCLPTAGCSQQGSRTLEPGKSPGRPHKVGEEATVLLEKDLKERPTATISQRRLFLEYLTGTTLSDSTVRRLMNRLGFSQKNGRWGRWNGTSY